MIRLARSAVIHTGGMADREQATRTHLATLVDEFERNASDVAIVATHGLRRRRITYGQLASLSRRFAAELSSRSISKGDRVLIWAENSPEWVAAFFGCVLRGVVPVPLDASSPAVFPNRVAREVAPVLLLLDRERSKNLDAIAPVILLDDLSEIITRDLADADASLTSADTLQVIFTSGTTSDPKGVVHTHGNVLASLRPIEQEMQNYLRYERIFHPLRFLHTLPLSHVFGQFMGLWIPPLLGAQVHLEPRILASDMPERIRRDRISLLASVPRTLDLLAQHVSNVFPGLQERANAARKASAVARWWQFRDVHRAFGLKFWAFVCGGAALPSAVEQFWTRLGFVVIQGYGMTETTALVSLNHPFHAREGTIGQVLPGREVRLSDEGEVLVRGDTISTATWQDGQIQPAESEWLATGDLAEFDEQGNLRFRGRKKDVIVTAAGLNIHPQDIEAALARQAGVRSAAVVETATNTGPEALAVLVLAPETDAESVVAAANTELAEFQQIRRWMIWPDPDFPTTSTGKVLKREIQRRIESGDVQLGQQNEELALDSLGRVELQARMEQQYGVTLDDAALQNVRTVQDVNQVIARRETQPVLKPGEPLEHRYPRWPWNRVMRAIRSAFLEAIAMPLVRLLTKPRVRNQVRRWPRKPVLIVSNHVTSYDVPFLLYALPGRIRRRTAVAMSGEMLLDYRRGRNQGHWLLNLLAPFAYWLITGLFNVFPLPQVRGFRRSFRHVGEAMDAGYSVIVFPEGRRSDDGRPQPFKGGAGLLWKELNVDALAMRLEGLGEIKATGARWFRTGTIQVGARALLPAQPERTPEELTVQLESAVFSSGVATFEETEKLTQ